MSAEGVAPFRPKIAYIFLESRANRLSAERLHKLPVRVAIIRGQA